MILKLSTARQMHFYLGLLFAPSIIFFASSGSLMVFSLHENHDGYEPPTWVEVVAQIHKNQKTTVGRKQPESAEASAVDRRQTKINDVPMARVLLKWFVLIMALGIILTTCLGIYMSFVYNKSQRLLWCLLISGLALPAALLLLQ